MGSPITFSGFNNIDFNTVLNALMNQAALPLNQLQARQNALKTQQTNFDSLRTKLSAVEDAASALSRPDNLSATTATSTDATAVSISSSGAAIAGHYDVVVRELARSQVTASASTVSDADVIAVATAGNLTIGGIQISVTQPVTLRQLAEAINNSDAPVTATVIASGPSEYRLVLTASSSGVANAFTIQNALSGGAGVTFTDTDNDGTTGDDAADNAVQALDADLSVNNITITSASNTLTEAIPGATLTLLKRDPAATVGVDVAADNSAAKNKLKDFITAYNAFASFASTQAAAARTGDESSIGRNPMIRGLQTDIRNSILQAQTTGGSLTNLAEIGVQFTRTGQIELNEEIFDAAMEANPDDVRALLSGDPANSAFARVASTLDTYTRTSGLLSSVTEQLTASISRLDTQIVAMAERLQRQRATLQAEFVEAEAAMTRLKNQSGNLSAIGSNLTTAF
ncbi:MAG: flagellar filament capping protein FliD [Vicinamibacterales bacterium]